MDYVIELRTLAADSGWNRSALIDGFLHGLSPWVKDQLITLEIPNDFDEVIVMTNKTDWSIQERETENEDFWQNSVSEMAILVSSVFWASQFPVWAHVIRAYVARENQVVSRREVQEILGGSLPVLWSAQSSPGQRFFKEPGSSQRDGTSEPNSLS